MIFGAEFGTGQVFWSFLWFSLFFMWIWLAVTIFTDIFRSRDLSGFGKTMWCLFVIVAPFLGSFVYLIARGAKMSEHAMDEIHRRDDLMRQYARDAAREATAPQRTTGAQLNALASLHDDGVITDDEWQRIKSRVPASLA